MTERDLFYCADLWCDGHARSNQTCVEEGLGLSADPVIEDDEEN
jgi:hypothetical protein